jgi:cytochrome c oxidase subunit 2
MGGHAQYEWVYIAVVVAILIWVGASSWDIERIIEEVPADAETIKVSGQQWFWSFEHADGTKEINELHVEQGKPYRFEMTSLDVNHNFNIPDFVILMDVIPGRINTLWNMFDQPGEYLIQCREYCGFSHYNMKAKLFVEPPTTTPVADDTAAEGGSTTTTGSITTPTVPQTQTSPGSGQRATVGTQPGEEGPAPGTSGNATTATTTTGGGTAGGAAPQGEQPQPQQQQQQQQQPAGVTLTILEGSSIQGNPDYDPEELTAKKGDKILVDNVDTMPHTVTNGESSTDPNSAKIFDTSIIMGGESAELDTANIDAGTYTYYCSVHPYMTGSLTIQ